MRDKYVADVGDFGKFQLFRYLFNHRESPMDGKYLARRSGLCMRGKMKKATMDGILIILNA